MNPWTRIDGWLMAHAPKIFALLDKPATEDEIRSVESALSVALPEEMRDSYKHHNGQGDNGGQVAGDWEILSLQNLLTNWQVQKELLDTGAFANAEAKAVGPARPDWWNVKWIPFAYNGVGDLQCVDLDPAPGGKVGQVVVYWHDREQRECVAGSMQEWLTSLADDFEAGKYFTSNATK